MGKFYGRKILEGILTINEVPTLWKNSTEKWLEENKRSVETIEDMGE